MTVIPTGPTYAQGDNGHLTMGVGELHMLAAHTLTEKAETLIGALEAIGVALKDLEISWAGEAKDEAQRLLDQWSTVSESIFGSKQHPQNGVLSRLIGGLESAAYTYNHTETIVQTSWNKLYSELNTIVSGGQPSGGGGDGQQSPPISEV